MTQPPLDPDDAELADLLRLVASLHAVPMTVEEIVRVARGAGHDVDGQDVEALLRCQHIRPRNTPFTSVEIRDRAKGAA